MIRPVSSAVALSLLWVALVVYASLYPFSPWHEIAADFGALLRLPWKGGGVGRFDVSSNIVGYMPLGALLFIAALRHGASSPSAWLRAVALAAALSYAMEVLQHFVPRRVPSSLDLALNVAGAAAGALLAWLAARRGAIERWHALRARWFVGSSAGVIVLLLLWPIGLLFPAPLPFGVGQVFDLLRELAEAALAGTPWEGAVAAGGAPSSTTLGAGAEMLAIALGLLAPSLLAYTIARPGWRRVPLLLGGVALGFAATTLSTALNFGPEHSLAWLGTGVLPATGTALVAGLALAWLPRRLVAGLALVAVTALVALVAQASTDPYYASSLLGWEQGRFIRFHGLAQWVGWLWPYAAIGVLLRLLAGREQN